MPLDDEDKMKMVELSAMGYSRKAIANRFGVTPQYVSTILTAVVAKQKEARSAARTQQAGRTPPKRATRRTA